MALNKVVLLGSGGLSIGQAGEFDYSGNQAIKALIEEGIEVVLVNPNIATVQTNPREKLKVYLYPVNAYWVEQVIAKELPDGIVGGFGGQTALNCLMELDDKGVLARYGVINLGTSPATIKLSEDRGRFAQKMREIGVPTLPSQACYDPEEALRIAAEISYPVIVRAAFTLGGLGSGFAHNETELRTLLATSFRLSNQVLIEKAVRGWKEIEYEVMRDSFGNAIAICNMENFDPLGVHTGDSIVVTPSQTMSDEEYATLRTVAIKIAQSVEVVGECNVQFALDPHSLQFYVIEINARLSRSSALASKASGYPIAYIAAKVVVGRSLVELKNPVTGITSAFYEPALDYVTVKIPKWDLKRFPGVDPELGSSMKSVGEVMAIGRSFLEALQKAVRMVTEYEQGLSDERLGSSLSSDQLREALSHPTEARLFQILECLRRGLSVEEIHKHSHVDPWFLHQLDALSQMEKKVLDHASMSKGDTLLAVQTLSDALLLSLKKQGFSDEQIAVLVLRGQKQSHGDKHIRNLSMQVREYRTKKGIRPCVKKIDTTSAEYRSSTNYYFLTYNGDFNEQLITPESKTGVLVLGGGCYRIGASIEFDWSVASCSQKLRELGYHSIIINCNPETVSTDYDSSDCLYFEEVSVERVLDIADLVDTKKVVCCMGGQLPNRISSTLADQAMELLGHSVETIHLAENRQDFSSLLDSLGIDQPAWACASSQKDMDDFLQKNNFPALIRPSFVLSGSAMKVVYDHPSLETYLEKAVSVSREHPVVLSKFYLGAKEIEVDGLARKGVIETGIISEHVEMAGVHSGDATTVLPAQNLTTKEKEKIKKIATEIAREVGLHGPFNIQMLIADGQVKVIECNARAARSFPFVSKIVGFDMAAAATCILLNLKGPALGWWSDPKSQIGVKAATFSFSRLHGADPISGVEMAATGEVGCIGDSFQEAMALAMEASGMKTPSKGVLISMEGMGQHQGFEAAAAYLRERGLTVYATESCWGDLTKEGVKAIALSRGIETLSPLEKKTVDLVLCTPSLSNTAMDDGRLIRQTAVKYGIPLLTDQEKSMSFLASLGAKEHGPLHSLGSFFRTESI